MRQVVPYGDPGQAHWLAGFGCVTQRVGCREADASLVEDDPRVSGLVTFELCIVEACQFCGGQRGGGEDLGVGGERGGHLAYQVTCSLTGEAEGRRGVRDEG